MGQVLPGSATTTEVVRWAIQRSEQSLRALARNCAISPTTVQKWRKRTTVDPIRAASCGGENDPPDRFLTLLTCGVTAYPAFPTWTATRPQRRSSNPTLSAFSISTQPRNGSGRTARLRVRRFDMICTATEIEHRLTKPNHPWSHEDKKTVRRTVFPNGGQPKRMNRTIKEATVRGYFYDDHEQLRRRLHSRPKAQTAQRPHSSTVHLERMAGQAGSFH